MTKKISISIVITLFLVFSCVQIFKSAYYTVLRVVSPFEVIIDKNSNGIEDDGETTLLDYGYSYVTTDNPTLIKFLKLTDEEAFIIEFLSHKFANDVLSDKKVELKNVHNNTELYINGEKYSDILNKSGLFFKNNKPINKTAYERRLKQISKSDYKIYNIKSNKYHNISCEYGRKARNFILLPKAQLPKGAKPCKYCLTPQQTKHININQNTIKPPKLVYEAKGIKFFLTDYTTHLKPNRDGNSAVAKELVKQIDAAKSTIDIAIYGYDRVPKIEQALKRAIKRGVVVRLVHDIDPAGRNIYANTFELVNLIKYASCDRATSKVSNKNEYENSIMHNKFYIFDNSVVITGSANLSHTDMSDYNANSAILIKSRDIAGIYTREFNQMYNSRFHYLKSKFEKPDNINIGNHIISVYFSPKDEIIRNKLIPIINKAKTYIYIPVFVITDQKLATALINAKKRGVDVRLIIDATNARNSYSKHKLLRNNGILVKTENYAGKMHSKSIIIDDLYTVSGSMNFSKSGENKNDENLVIVKNSALAKFYKNYFIYLWSKINNYCLTHDVSSEGIYSIGSCTDGIDNDYDGKTDMDDEGCKFIKKKTK